MKISLKYDVIAPEGVKIITNTENHLTFARVVNGEYHLYTCPSSDFEFDLTNVSWQIFTEGELEKILKLK